MKLIFIRYTAAAGEQRVFDACWDAHIPDERIEALELSRRLPNSSLVEVDLDPDAVLRSISSRCPSSCVLGRH